jgi:hypothetical protein
MVTSYDIVVVPSKELAQKALAVSESVKHLGVEYTLELGKFYPHISLYMLNLEEGMVVQCIEELEKLAQNFAPIFLEASAYMTTALRWLDIGYHPTPEILHLQNECIARLNSLRTGIPALMLERESEGLAKENIEMYGYRSVGENYRPHMTFTRFIKPQPESVALLPQKTDFTGSFVKIGLYEIDQNGSCTKELWTS